MLISYIKTKKELDQNLKFERTFVLREKVDDDIQKCKDLEILLCSCYVWNWEITNYFAKEVKKINPNCLIVFGGPQVPNHSEGFFEEYPYVDILVHGEGEYVLANLFAAFLKNKNYSNVNGIETKDFRNPPEPRIDNLEAIPSVYLTNLMWDVVEKIEGVHWLASWETNRGCPYACTFCDQAGTGARTRSPRRAVDEVRHCVEDFGVKEISFWDDTMSYNKKWMREFCELLIEASWMLSGLVMRQ